MSSANMKSQPEPLNLDRNNEPQDKHAQGLQDQSAAGAYPTPQTASRRRNTQSSAISLEEFLTEEDSTSASEHEPSILLGPGLQSPEPAVGLGIHSSSHEADDVDEFLRGLDSLSSGKLMTEPHTRRALFSSSPVNSVFPSNAAFSTPGDDSRYFEEALDDTISGQRRSESVTRDTQREASRPGERDALDQMLNRYGFGDWNSATSQDQNERQQEAGIGFSNLELGSQAVGSPVARAKRAGDSQEHPAKSMENPITKRQRTNLHSMGHHLASANEGFKAVAPPSVQNLAGETAARNMQHGSTESSPIPNAPKKRQRPQIKTHGLFTEPAKKYRSRPNPTAAGAIDLNDRLEKESILATSPDKQRTAPWNQYEAAASRIGEKHFEVENYQHVSPIEGDSPSQPSFKGQIRGPQSHANKNLQFLDPITPVQSPTSKSGEGLQKKDNKIGTEMKRRQSKAWSRPTERLVSGAIKNPEWSPPHTINSQYQNARPQLIQRSQSQPEMAGYMALSQQMQQQNQTRRPELHVQTPATASTGAYTQPFQPLVDPCEVPSRPRFRPFAVASDGATPSYWEPFSGAETRPYFIQSYSSRAHITPMARERRAMRPLRVEESLDIEQAIRRTRAQVMERVRERGIPFEMPLPKPHASYYEEWRDLEVAYRQAVESANVPYGRKLCEVVNWEQWHNFETDDFVNIQWDKKNAT